ncbi:MAG TPA: hypothetical protein VE178_15735 [Silvibacterium sp.]|jgi:hypothetical protein|nr:hypothetical protein [Silvibacterium sp.]
MRAATIFVVMLCLGTSARLCAQAASATPAHIETVQDLLPRLTPEQKQRFEAAIQAHQQARYADSLESFKGLQKDLPGEIIIAKFAANNALETGDISFVVAQLKPITQANPDDWQACAMLTRAYAESGDKVNRDAGMTYMLDLHKRGLTPQNMQKYTLERAKVGDNVMVIQTSLEPWGYYKVYDLGQVSDGSGQIFLQTTLESNDFDQPGFAKRYPKEASQGLRQFSLDAYRETGLNSNGQKTQTHYTYQFFVGQPSYDTVREAFINIASGKSKPISSRSNIIVP